MGCTPFLGGDLRRRSSDGRAQEPHKLASAWSGVLDNELSSRVTMAILGGYFVFTGNAMPKMLTPLSALRHDPAMAQAFRRIGGWIWVLSGFGFTIAWLALPIDLATPVSVALLLGGTILYGAQMARLSRKDGAPSRSMPDKEGER